MFELLNVKWGEPTFGTPSGTVTWSSDLGGNLALNNGATDASINATLNAALQAWEDVAAIDFVRDDANPMFTFGAEPIDVAFAGVARFGPDLAGLNSLSGGEIIFNSLYLWSDNGGPGSTDFYAVALHEIGHMIGLDHPDDPTQIMNAVIQVDDLGLGDIQGAQFLYGTDSGDVPVTPGQPANSGDLGLTQVDGGDGGGGGGGGGILLGLLALLATLFTGGAGGFVAMAAGRISGTLDGDEDEQQDGVADPALAPLPAGHFYGDGHNHGEGHSHGVAIEEFALLPGIDFTQKPNPCGCVGLCEHIIDKDDCAEDVFV
ncbi:MAG: matrixin family metalloprotease [Pseudomonadota bacterium]